MLLGLVLLALSAVALLAGAELFAEHAGSAGRRLGVTALAMGVLVVGAEPEELITAVTAGVRDRPGIGVGDAVGANLTMLTLALGLAAVLRPLPLRGRVRSYALGATVAGVAAALVLADGRTSRPEGAALIGLYIVLVAVVWARERQAPAIGELAEVLEDDADPEEEERPAVGLALAVVGVAVMALGGAVAVGGAERMVDALSITDTAVGLTLVALATTAELLAPVWAAARRDVSELAVAAIVGSAAYNATATLGAAALARPATGLDVRSAAAVAAALPVAVLLAGAGPEHCAGPRASPSSPVTRCSLRPRSDDQQPSPDPPRSHGSLRNEDHQRARPLWRLGRYAHSSQAVDVQLLVHLERHEHDADGGDEQRRRADAHVAPPASETSHCHRPDTRTPTHRGPPSLRDGSTPWAGQGRGHVEHPRERRLG